MERIVSQETREQEEQLEEHLRPQRLEDFVGQDATKRQLRIAVEAARKRGEALDHVLLSGPPGLGKTTLAHIIANELGTGFKRTSGPVLEKKAVLAACLTDLEKRDVVFVDEIHRLNRLVEETLYPAMEDFVIEVIVGDGPYAKTLRLNLPPFTLIGATTRSGMLSSPLRDRFGLLCRLNFYEVDDILKIVHRSARILSITLEAGGAEEIARRARRTPRVANRLLRRVWDYAEVRAAGIITTAVAREALEMLEVDEAGLEALDREILRTIIDKFNSGPVGLKSLAVAIGEDPDTIEEVYEPFLIQMGYMHRTPQGRVVTRRAFEHLGRQVEADGTQASLF